MNLPLPNPKEEERLADLREFKVFGTPNEDVYDGIVELACRLMGTPMGIISLVENDLQCFKAKVGIEVCQTTRAVSFCAHGLNSVQPLIVEDAHLDERFAQNPLVTGAPFIRYYVGSPLITRKGNILGMLACIDTVPHQPPREDVTLLTRLARLTMELLEARKTVNVINHHLRLLDNVRQKSVAALNQVSIVTKAS